MQKEKPAFLFRLKAFALKMFFFTTEQALLKGKQLQVKNKPTVVFFTLHKSASSLLSIRMAPFFYSLGYKVADLSSFFARTSPGLREKFMHDEQMKQRVFSVSGIFHVAFRFPFSIPGKEKLKIILVLRDPRDILVSYYYSAKYSHRIINAEQSALHDLSHKVSIDEYVMQKAPVFCDRLSEYVKWMSEPNVLFARYEDLISSPAEFEQRLSVFLNEKIVPGTIISPTDFVVDREDEHAHKRQVSAGDHVRKLKPETIRELNKLFGEILPKLGYTVS